MTEPNKRYELTLEEHPHYLHAHIKAPSIDEPLAIEYLTEIAAICTETGCERLLFVREIPEMLDDGTLFFVTAEFNRMIRGVRTAFVNPFATNQNAFDFAMTVGANRGADYAVFGNTDEALVWLLDDVDQ